MINEILNSIYQRIIFLNPKLNANLIKHDFTIFISNSYLSIGFTKKTNLSPNMKKYLSKKLKRSLIQI